MNKLSLRDVDVRGRRVLCRVDFNVPLRDGRVADDTRIRAALPTLRHVLDRGGSLVLMSHLGRPKGNGYEAGLSLKPVAEALAARLDRPVRFGADCVGDETIAEARALRPGEVMLVENTRFHKEEEGKVKLPETADDADRAGAKKEMKARQEAFARRLAGLGDGEVFVNDAFGSAHRAHGSTAVVCRFFRKNAAGFLMERELEALGRALAKPDRPFVAILGGAKVSDKVNVIRNLLGKVDSLILGGAMAYTFLRARGLPTGDSLVEEDRIELARDLMSDAEAAGVKILLPVDHIVADRFAADAAVRTVGEGGIGDGWMALDIGPETAEWFAGEIRGARTVVWNGPMGCFEMAPFAEGTMRVARAIAETDCLSVVGGGDSVRAVNQSGLADRMSHISTGGGASLEFLEGRALPGVAALTDREPA